MRVTQILFVLLWFFCVYAPLRFVQMSRMTTEHGSLMASAESWSLVLFITRVPPQWCCSVPSFCVSMWSDLIQKSKDGGLDVIETYVFWNLYEPVQGQVLFCSVNVNIRRADLVKFVKAVAAAGLYVHLRIGPYACAEWNYGPLTFLNSGFPLWLHFIPGIQFRTDNKPFEAAVYKTGSVCAAFLANIATSDATVTFNGNSYHLPAWSVSILPDCKNVVLNTAKINSAPMISSFTTESLKEEVGSLEGSDSGWSWISEPIGISKADSFPKFGLLEQINATADKSDYLWYWLRYIVYLQGLESFLLTSNSLPHDDAGSQTVLHIESLGHALHAFINGKLVGSGTGNSGKAKVNVDIPVPLVAEKNAIDLLSLTVELQNYGAFFDTWGAGITGLVISKGLKNGSTVDLSSQQWTYLVGLKYEDLGPSSGSSGQWNSQSTLPTNQSLTWYKVIFIRM
ncbi:Beta-galactosidase 8 [Glycine max]|nr:Beta-galactosidase 8 [Glycine max]